MVTYRNWILSQSRKDNTATVDRFLIYVFIQCNLCQSHLYRQQICQLKITNWLIQVSVIGSCIFQQPRLKCTSYIRNGIAAWSFSSFKWIIDATQPASCPSNRIQPKTFCYWVIPNRCPPPPGIRFRPVVTSPLPHLLPYHHLFTPPAVGCHGLRALQDHGAGEGGGRPPAPSTGLPAEGGRRVSVPATDQQPQGPSTVSGEKGLVDTMLPCCIQSLSPGLAMSFT